MSDDTRARINYHRRFSGRLEQVSLFRNYERELINRNVFRNDERLRYSRVCRTRMRVSFNGARLYVVVRGTRNYGWPARFARVLINRKRRRVMPLGTRRARVGGRGEFGNAKYATFTFDGVNVFFFSVLSTSGRARRKRARVFVRRTRQRALRRDKLKTRETVRGFRKTFYINYRIRVIFSPPFRAILSRARHLPGPTAVRRTRLSFAYRYTNSSRSIAALSFPCSRLQPSVTNSACGGRERDEFLR